MVRRCAGRETPEAPGGHASPCHASPSREPAGRESSLREGVNPPRNLRFRPVSNRGASRVRLGLPAQRGGPALLPVRGDSLSDPSAGTRWSARALRDRNSRAGRPDGSRPQRFPVGMVPGRDGIRGANRGAGSRLRRSGSAETAEGVISAARRLTITGDDHDPAAMARTRRHRANHTAQPPSTRTVGRLAPARGIGRRLAGSPVPVPVGFRRIASGKQPGQDCGRADDGRRHDRRKRARMRRRGRRR